MKTTRLDEETRTIEMRLSHPELYPAIEQVLSFYASLRHRLWRDLIVKRSSINDLKRFYIANYGVTARQFNSLAKEIGAKALALEELKKERRAKLCTAIKSITAAIVKAEKRVEKRQSILKAIASYRSKIKTWQDAPTDGRRPAKKPKMPASIRGQFRDRLRSEIEKDWAYIHQKKRRLGILSHKLTALDAAKQASLCFGGKAYFRHQYHLDKTEIGSHEEWLEGFRQRRSSQAFFLGSSDETAGNQTVQYDADKLSLKLRLPNAPEFAALGSHLIFESLTFPENLRDSFYATLGKPGAEARKNQKTAGPISYRFVRRVNPNTKEKAYYIQASFSVPEAEKVTKLTRGAIGVDLNADHVAVTETDPFGNYLDSFVLPFDLKRLSCEQTKAIIGDLSAVITEHALKTGKALSIEELDFEEKKKALREQPKERRAFLSAFAYSHFQKAIRSKSRAMGVELISINPAFTSLIGAYKYQGLKISSHEKAALAIARRAQGYSEGLKVFQGTLPTQVMMSERTLFEKCSRHVWGFYGDHRQKIRSLLIETDRRPLLPLLRAISLARAHPSLCQSLIVTREKRVEEALRRASA